METSINGKLARDWLEEKFYKDELNNSDLVSIIILLCDLLKLKSITEYSVLKNKTYKGVSDFNRNIIEILGKRFVIDND